MTLRYFLLWLVLISIVALFWMLTPGIRFLVEEQPNAVLGLITGVLGLAIGLKSEAFYARSRRSFMSIHHAQLFQNGVVFMLAWAGGMDAVAAMGAMMLGDVLFQARVNRAFDNPLIDALEEPTYDLGDNEIPKFFYGRGRYLQLIVGVLLILWNLIL